MDCIIHGIAKSWTQLRDCNLHFSPFQEGSVIKTPRVPTLTSTEVYVSMRDVELRTAEISVGLCDMVEHFKNITK